MLKLLGARQLGSAGHADVLQVLDADPIATCMVAARVQEFGVDPRAINGELWSRGGPGGVAVLRGRESGSAAAGTRRPAGVRRPRLSVSADVFVAGRPRRVALPLWEMLEADWGPAARGCAPSSRCSRSARAAWRPPDPLVRQVRMDETRVVPAGRGRDVHRGGRDRSAGQRRRAGYRRRVAGLIAVGAGLGPVRGRRGGLQGGGRVDVRQPSARSRVCGSIPRGAARASERPAPRPSPVRSPRGAHREPVRQQLQRARTPNLRDGRVHTGRHLRDGAARLIVRRLRVHDGSVTCIVFRSR